MNPGYPFAKSRESACTLSLGLAIEALLVVADPINNLPAIYDPSSVILLRPA
jgi:hypothetical protein